VVRSPTHRSTVRGPLQSELHGLLRDDLTGQLTAAEWAVDLADDTDPGGVMLGAIRRQVLRELAEA
jgi:hypothetical protein